MSGLSFSDRLIERYVGMWPISHQVLAVSQFIRPSNVVIGIRRRMLMPMPEVGGGVARLAGRNSNALGEQKIVWTSPGCFARSIPRGTARGCFPGCYAFGLRYCVFNISTVGFVRIRRSHAPWLLGSAGRGGERIHHRQGCRRWTDVGRSIGKRESRYDVSIEEATFGVLCTDLEGTPYCSIRVPENVSHLVGDVPRDALLHHRSIRGDRR